MDIDPIMVIFYEVAQKFVTLLIFINLQSNSSQKPLLRAMWWGLFLNAFINALS